MRNFIRNLSKSKPNNELQNNRKKNGTAKGETIQAWWRNTPTFQCELEALTAMAQLNLNVPRVVAYRCFDGAVELVLEAIDDAMTLPQYWATYIATPRRRAVIKQLAQMVGTLHRAGWIHGSIAGGHILIQPHQGDKVWLIDFEKAERVRLKHRFEKDLRRFIRRSSYLSNVDEAYFLNHYQNASGFADLELSVTT